MKITMDGAEFNRIMRVCIPALDKKGSRPVLEHIEIRCAGGVGAATACDSIHLAQCRFEYEGDDGMFMLPRHRTVSNGSRITINVKGDKISISDGEETVTRNLCKDVPPDWRKIVTGQEEKPQAATITMSASRLRRILGSFDSNNDAVTFEIRGPLVGVVMRGPSTYGMLLPIRVEEGRHLARFVKPGEEWGRNV